jgi:Spy/CpxP family protein refolding chaperone
MRTLLVLSVALLVACPALAGPKHKGQKKADAPAAKAVDQMTKNLTLTEEQKTKLDGIKKEYDPKLAAAQKATEVLTPEQKKAGQEAQKAAKAAGKKGKEAKQAVEDAQKVTPEQKTKMADAQKQLKAVTQELRDKVLSVLTPEQKDQLKPKKRGKNK